MKSENIYTPGKLFNIEYLYACCVRTPMATFVIIKDKTPMSQV
jgi:hypothetical protein